MRYLSVCSGIEAATVAWHPLGWEAAAFAEIEPFPSSVLAHHYPTVPNLGDMSKFKEWNLGAIDLLVGGTPCQSFSVAGLRKGLADPRGNLMLTYLAIANQYRPRWLVWENVPGVLSSNGGRDFGTFLGGLGELGYGFAYRVLDAQYFGVAQRRRRVFVVGCLGDWRSAAAVLFERDSLQGNPAPSRITGKGAAKCLTRGANQRLDFETEDFVTTGTLSSRSTGGGGLGTDFECAGGLIAHTLKGEGFDASEDGTGRGTPLVPVAFSAKDCGADATEDLSPTLRAGGFDKSHANSGNWMGVAAFKGGQGSAAGGIGYDEHVAPTLSAADSGSNRTPTLMAGMQVRRLTPVECERLQGFPDHYTLVPHNGKPAADGPRYKALGNSMAVPVMHWIGKRIDQVEQITAVKDAA